MLFKELKDQIDLELKQGNTDGINYDDDSYKAASSDEVKIWCNESLNYFSTMNPLMWFTVLPVNVTNSSYVLDIPKGIKKVKRVKVNSGNFYSVNMPYSDSDMISDSICTWNGGSQIIFKNKLIAGDTVFIEGVFYPEKVVDDNSTVDIKQEWERLLKLSIIEKHSARDNLKTGNFHAEYLSTLKQFKNAQPQVQVVSRFTTDTSFYY